MSASLAFLCVLLVVPGWAQDSSSITSKPASGDSVARAGDDAVSPELAKAEAAIVKVISSQRNFCWIHG